MDQEEVDVVGPEDVVAMEEKEVVASPADTGVVV